MRGERRMTAARRLALAGAVKARVEGGYPGYSIITSFKSGETHYGHQTKVVAWLRDAGFIDDEGRATEAGRRALAADLEGTDA